MLEVQRTKEANEDRLQAKPGVVGVGVGEKWVSGVPGTQQAIMVFVDKKRSRRNVLQKFNSDALVPDEIDGIPTDVIEVGKLVKHGFPQRVRPVKPGYSAGHPDITAGTIGGLFLDADNEPVILSNNHVLANENKAKVGDLIYQPGPADSRGNLDFRGWDTVIDIPYIGTLKRFYELAANGNPHDSAIAAVHPRLVAAGLMDPLYPVMNAQCRGFGVVHTGMQVQKAGRTTGYTTGRVIAVNASFTITYDFGPAQFVNCAVMTGMSKGGDSGSVIMDMGHKAVALLFAGSPKVTLANPIGPIVDYYGLKLWNPTNVAGIDTLDFGDKTWQQVGGGSVNDGKIVTVTVPANKFSYVESPLGEFNSVQVTVNTGTDQGATWGPGLAVMWPTGVIKVNLRHNHRFGGSFNGAENLSIGAVKPNTDYVLRIRRSSTHTWVGEVRDGDRWYTVIELPTNIFPHAAVSVRVGKTDMHSGPGDHSDQGAVGTCTFRDFQQD